MVTQSKFELKKNERVNQLSLQFAELEQKRLSEQQSKTDKWKNSIIKDMFLTN
jgi:hypothetical protein